MIIGRILDLWRIAAEVFVLCATWTIPHAARRETARLRDSDAGYDRWESFGQVGGLSKLLFANRG